MTLDRCDCWAVLGMVSPKPITSTISRPTLEILKRFANHTLNILDNDLSTAVPPCFIVAAGLDPLKDDSEALHELLDIAGVDNEFVVYPKVIHAFLHHSRMLDDTMDAMRRAADFFHNHKI